MTDQQTDVRYHEDEYGADPDEDAGYVHYVDHYDGDEDAGPDTWDSPGDWDAPDDWDSLDDWDAYVATARPATPARVVRPWYRDPRWLFALIALAAAALVVATVLLVTGRGSGEIPTAPELTTRTPATTTTPSPRSAPPREAATSSPTTPTSAAPGSEEPSAVDIPAPVEPTASATEVPPEPPAPSASKSPAGPRINVTRTPMSFSPGNR